MLLTSEKTETIPIGKKVMFLYSSKQNQNTHQHLVHTYKCGIIRGYSKTGGYLIEIIQDKENKQKERYLGTICNRPKISITRVFYADV